MKLLFQGQKLTDKEWRKMDKLRLGDIIRHFKQEIASETV